MDPLITIHVQLHTTLQRQTAQGPLRRLELQLPTASTVSQALQRLEVTADPADLLLVVNGRTVEVTQILSDGDEVHFIPAISGGSQIS